MAFLLVLACLDTFTIRTIGTDKLSVLTNSFDVWIVLKPLLYWKLGRDGFLVNGSEGSRSKVIDTSMLASLY